MPVYRPLRSQIILDLGLCGYGNLSVMERAIFTEMHHQQPRDTRACVVSATAEIVCYALDPDGHYSVDLSALIPPRTVTIAGSNDTYIDASTYEELAQRDVAGGETPAEFEARCEALPQLGLLQGDGFNIERDRAGGIDMNAMLLHHLQVAAARGRYARKLA